MSSDIMGIFRCPPKTCIFGSISDTVFFSYSFSLFLVDVNTGDEVVFNRRQTPLYLFRYIHETNEPWEKIRKIKNPINKGLYSKLPKFEKYGPFLNYHSLVFIGVIVLRLKLNCFKFNYL
uniref:Uncharacterized protein n=1 Tax=Cacopsylla melanoneura TaxID=428564 RepID=A0A8D9BU20_9HEMI